MSRALVTFGVTGMDELLEIALPGFQDYASLHGYTLLTRPPSMLLRPPSWHKITALLDALDDHDEALWIDCDCVIADPSWDLADDVPDTAWQAITRHQTPEGEVPSAGVWYLRKSMQVVLEAIWRMTKYMHHRWWEQGALQELLGYTPLELPVHHDHETELYRNTHWLGSEWNALALPAQPLPEARIVHCAPGSPIGVRAQTMRHLAALTLKGA